jgi:hypothetical protein
MFIDFHSWHCGVIADYNHPRNDYHTTHSLLLLRVRRKNYEGGMLFQDEYRSLWGLVPNPEKIFFQVHNFVHFNSNS